MSVRARLLLVLAALVLALTPMRAQEQAPADSLVRLMSAQSAQMFNTEKLKYRKVIGPARFLHNGTYLLCDTAIWYVDEKIINAFGHVQILQDETVLSSDKLDYKIEDNTAEFRGSLVQLSDKDGNLLRTRHLDYNTKDSIAIFSNGAAMRDKDGQIIESFDGTYDSKIKQFNFLGNVNMYTDSVFVKTNNLIYEGESGEAHFFGGVDAWQDDKMLSSETAVYDKGNEVFHFLDNVHALSDTRECWADSLLFYKLENNAELFGHTQILDTVQNVSAVAEYVKYVDTLSRVTLQGEAAVIAVTNQDGQIDTLYLGADMMSYTSVPDCNMDPAEFSAAEQRLKNLEGDPVNAYRKKAADNAAEEASKAKREKAEARGLKGPQAAKGAAAGGSLTPDFMNPEEDAEKEPAPEEDSSEETESAAENDAPQEEPVAETVDTVSIAVVKAVGNVRLFRRDIQARCDSLVYTDLDSLGRLYIDPIVWNEEGRHQYTSDSLFIVIADGKMQKASLQANAFIAIQEDSISFDQIRGAEMMAYFDTTSALSRFDALGGSDAMFYLRENETLATVNKVESKMLSARFENGELSQIYYFDSPKNDAYPVVQLPKEDRKKKGFDWRPEQRPKSKKDVTLLDIRHSERRMYESRPKASFKETNRYFPGYIDDVIKRRAIRDSLKHLPKVEEPQLDSLALPVDSLALSTDSLAVQTDTLVSAADSLTIKVDINETVEPKQDESAKVDTLDFSSPEAALESLAKATAAPEEQKPQEEPDLKAQQKAEKQAQKEQKQKEREARIAELDARDAARAEAKHQKELEKQRAKTLKLLKKQEKREAKEQKILDRYVRRYEKLKARKDKDLPEIEEGLNKELPGDIEKPAREKRSKEGSKSKLSILKRKD